MSASSQMDTIDGQDNGESMREGREITLFVFPSMSTTSPTRCETVRRARRRESERERLSRESEVLAPRRPASLLQGKCLAARVLLTPGEPGEIEVEVASTSGPVMHVADQSVVDDRALVGRVSRGSALEAHPGSWTVHHGRQTRGCRVSCTGASHADGALRRAVRVVWARPEPVLRRATPIASHGINLRVHLREVRARV